MVTTMDRCAFRLDDITPDMNWDNFDRIRGLFGKYHIKPLLGIVPCNQDKHLAVQPARGDFWEIIKGLEEEGYVLSQHGYCHVYETKNSGLLGLNPFSEFAGLPYEVQLKKLQQGKEILQNHGIYVTIFMAPGHTYDNKTLKALKACGFRYVSDGYSNKCYCKKGLIFIPSRQSKPAVSKGFDTICLHINQMGDGEFKELERFLHENRKAVIDYGQLLKLEAVRRRGLMTAMGEHQNLFIRKLKYFVSSNQILHEYLEKTDTGNARKKMRNRIIGIPGLGVRLILGIFKREK